MNLCYSELRFIFNKSKCMRKSVFMVAAAMLLSLTGCVKKEGADCERGNSELVEIPFTFSCEGYSSKVASPSYEDESKIHWVDVFVSVDGGDYCRHRVVPGGDNVIAVKKGTSYMLGAVANAPSHEWDVSELVSTTNGKAYFNTSLCRLSDNQPDSFVMMVDNLQPYTGVEVHFELKRRVNKCTVLSVKNLWGDPEKFEITEIYLANVFESSATNPNGEKLLYNDGGYKTSAVDELVYANVNCPIAYGESVDFNHSLYYLPLGGPLNYLVLNAVADGVPMSYSFALPNTIVWNQHFSYDLTITHAGDLDMVPNAGGSVQVSEVGAQFTVSDWDETSELRGF